MAKITHKGMWIELKSLDKDAKSKYIPHLHWVIYMNGNRINPEIVLNKDFPMNLLADYQDVPADLPQSEE